MVFGFVCLILNLKKKVNSLPKNMPSACRPWVTEKPLSSFLSLFSVPCNLVALPFSSPLKHVSFHQG